MFVKKVEYFLFPLSQACLGVSAGISFASYFITSWNLYFIWFQVFGCFLLFLVVKKYKLPLFTNIFIQAIFFFFAGGLIFSLHSLLINEATSQIQKQKTILATVEDITFSPRSKYYKYSVSLRLFEISPLFLSWRINLFIRSNFVSIGEQLSLNEFVFQPGKNYDFCNGSLGTIFYQPKKIKVYKLRTKNLSLKNRLIIAKKTFTEKILEKLSPKTKSFFGQLFLGKKQKELIFELRDIFENWGISHYLARSGLHLTVFSYIAALVFLIIPLPLIFRYLFLVFLSLFYYFMTFPSVSFLRAELMFLLFLMARIFSREVNQLHFLSIAYLSLLLFNPFLLFALDFQLTFSLVLGLLLLGKLSF